MVATIITICVFALILLFSCLAAAWLERRNQHSKKWLFLTRIEHLREKRMQMAEKFIKDISKFHPHVKWNPESALVPEDALRKAILRTPYTFDVDPGDEPLGWLNGPKRVELLLASIPTPSPAKKLGWGEGMVNASPVVESLWRCCYPYNSMFPARIIRMR